MTTKQTFPEISTIVWMEKVTHLYPDVTFTVDPATGVVIAKDPVRGDVGTWTLFADGIIGTIVPPPSVEDWTTADLTAATYNHHAYSIADSEYVRCTHIAGKGEPSYSFFAVVRHYAEDKEACIVTIDVTKKQDVYIAEVVDYLYYDVTPETAGVFMRGFREGKKLTGKDG